MVLKSTFNFPGNYDKSRKKKNFSSGFSYFILYVLYFFVDISFLLVLSTHLNYDINDFIFREVFQCLKKLKRALTGLA